MGGERGRNRTYNLLIKSLFRVFSALSCSVHFVYKNPLIMRLQVNLLLVGMTEFGDFRMSWHTIGTLDWGEPPPRLLNHEPALCCELKV